MNSNIPTILITGSVGKTITLRYINHILYNDYKFKTLYFELNEDNKLSKAIINGLEQIDIDIYKLGFEFVTEGCLDANEQEAFLIHEIARENKVDVILGKNSMLNIYFNVIVCGLTNIDYDRAIDVEETLNRMFSYFYLKQDVPLVSCPQPKVLSVEIYNICKAGLVPLFKANFYHLKYINFDTGIKTRYSYLNLALALTMCKIFLNNFNGKEYRKYDITRYKKVECVSGMINLCSYVNPLPMVKNIEFREYSKNYVYTPAPNLNFYVEIAGTFKATNLLVSQFNRFIESRRMQDENVTVVPLLIFSCLPSNELFLTTMPLSTFDFEHFFIVDYNLKGYSFDKLLPVFENPQKYFNLKSYKQNDEWTRTIYEAVTYIYSDENLIGQRKKSMSPLDEYYGLEENVKKCSVDILPKNPTITVDTLPYIKKWLTRLAKKYPKIQYYVLCTGCKKLVDDIFETFEL